MILEGHHPVAARHAPEKIDGFRPWEKPAALGKAERKSNHHHQIHGHERQEPNPQKVFGEETAMARKEQKRGGARDPRRHPNREIPEKRCQARPADARPEPAGKDQEDAKACHPPPPTSAPRPGPRRAQP